MSYDRQIIIFWILYMNLLTITIADANLQQIKKCVEHIHNTNTGMFKSHTYH